LLRPSNKQTSTENCNRRPPMQNKFIGWPEQTLEWISASQTRDLAKK
jgi:hypothetical protein